MAVQSARPVILKIVAGVAGYMITWDMALRVFSGMLLIFEIMKCLGLRKSLSFRE